jgi:hypothetical protein
VGTGIWSNKLPHRSIHDVAATAKLPQGRSGNEALLKIEDAMIGGMSGQRPLSRTL